MRHGFIAPEHIMLALAKDENCSAMCTIKALGIHPEQIVFAMENILESLQSSTKAELNDTDLTTGDSIPFMPSTERAMRSVKLEAQAMNMDEMHTAHLMLSLIREKTTKLGDFFQRQDISYESVQEEARRILNVADDGDDSDGPFASPGRGDEDNSKRGTPQQAKKNTTGSDTPVLDSFGLDMTKAAEEGRLDPVVGREKEIERLAQILSRRKKNNPMLIGEPGVGKSAVAEGLALRICEKKVPAVLLDKRLVSLDVASMVAGTKYRGQFEERVKSLLNLASTRT